MNTDKLREKYLYFFEDKKHTIFPSDSLVSLDPTVLFTPAGMNQFKPYFLGEKKGLKRTASCQKCLRTADLEKVGKTPYHHTFFEMLGNFSFGDYFKKEAIEFAWEFLTSSLNIKEKYLWVSVYYQDKETYNIWKECIGIPKEKIISLGADDNFWPPNAPEKGPDGPCGPCSEIFFDRGKDKGCLKDTCNPTCGCGRFVEIWNLVFTQFNRKGKNKLEPLPQKNIDTGMGLERMASVLQNKDSNFEIDILKPLIIYTYEILKVKNIDKFPINLINTIVDHARAVTFAICDGVFPSNEERGYVVRKLIRKALWNGYTLGYKKAFVHKLVKECGKIMQRVYPEILKNSDRIANVILMEEEKFLSTIEGAKSQFSIIVDQLKRDSIDVIDGEIVFRLYDTYGLPLELTKEMASQRNLKLDEDKFYELLKKQKELSRKKSMFTGTIFAKESYSLKNKSEFKGYESLREKAKIVTLLKEKKEVAMLKENNEGIVVLNKTPFYPESGGQLADKGYIQTKNGKFVVEYVQKNNEVILHIGKVISGKIEKGICEAVVDKQRREALMRAHTATHLLQSALRNILGEHITQQGSLVDVDRLRFDFTHPKALTDEEINLIEEKVNQFIIRGDDVIKEYLNLNEARKKGALAFFKEKYKDIVRMVSIADYSKELCGGTHIDNTACIILFYILSESSISSGVRRIEAVVGKEALRKALFYKNIAKDLSYLLKVKEEDIAEKVMILQKTVKEYEIKLKSLEKDLLSLQLDNIIKESTDIKGKTLFIIELKNKNYTQLLHLADLIRSRYHNSLVFITSSLEKYDIFVFAITKKVYEEGFSLNRFLKQYRDSLGIRGGGKNLISQGKLVKKLDKKLLQETIRDFINKSNI